MLDPYFELLYEGTDITPELVPNLRRLTFTDNREGQSDELSIELADPNHLWMGPYLPGRADRVDMQLGYLGGDVLGPIGFELDRFDWSGGQGKPSTISIRGLATPIRSSLREKKTRAWEGVTLTAIARDIAQDNDLSLVGEVPPIKLERVTQKEETDLAFLRRLAGDYGLIFKIEGAQRLVFYSVSDLEAADPVMLLSRKQALIGSYRVTRASVDTYKNAKVSYFDPLSGKLLTALVDADGQAVATPVAGETTPATDTSLVIREPFDNLQQAKAIAVSRLHRKNRGELKMSLQCLGLPLLAAGSNVSLTDFLAFSGKYQVDKVTHTLSKQSGYRTDLELVGLELDYDRAD